jgi:O-antigen/teichoic acid export membrane protein
VGLNLAVSVALARTAGAYAYGLYAFALSMAVLLAIPTTVALATFVLREVAWAAAQGRWDLLRGVEIWAIRRALVTSITAAGIALGSVLLFGAGMTPEWRLTVALGLALVPLLSLNSLCAAVLRGLHHVIVGQLPDQIAIPTFMLVLLGCGLALGHRTIDGVTAVSWHATAAAASLVVGIVLWRWRRPIEIRTTRATSNERAWRVSAMTFLMLSGLGVVNQELHVLLLGALAGPTAAGIFRVSVRGAELVAFGLSSINAAIAPTVARLHALGDRRRVRRLVRLSTLASSLWALPIAIVMIAFGPAILGAMFGQDFVAGATSLTILSIGQLVNAMTGPVGLLLNMTGRERVAARGQAIATIVNVSLGLVLIPRWGIEGAAIATAASLVTWNAIFAIEARRV